MKLIEIVDPGWDWGLFGLIVLLSCSPFLIAGVAALVSISMPTRRTVERVQAFAGGAVVAGVICVVIGFIGAGLSGTFHWSDRFGASVTESMAELGYDIVQVETMEATDSYMLMGVKDDEPFTGMIHHVTGNQWQLIGAGKD